MNSQQTALAGSSGSSSQTEVLGPAQQTNNIVEPQTLRLRLATGAAEKKVSFNAGTIDNENMNKKKSKCCCIFKKPLKFGESSSEDEDDCDHCIGHVENKKKKKTIESPDKMQEPQ